MNACPGGNRYSKIYIFFLTVLYVFFSVFKSVNKYSCNKESIFCSFNQTNSASIPRAIMYRNYAENASLTSFKLLEIACFKLENFSKKASLRKMHLNFKSYMYMQYSRLPAFTNY